MNNSARSVLILGGPSGVVSAPSGLAGHTSSASVTAPVTERFVVIPRDRKCPLFNGKTVMGIVDWTEEVQTCARARHLPAVEQALFIFDHLEGKAKEKIKFRPREEQRDPVRVLAILKELYGCSQSYVTLQQAFFFVAPTRR